MATLITPSAKSHERVSGRWTRDYTANSAREKVIYYVKTMVGTPVPWLFMLFMLALFTSRAAAEVIAWTIGALSLVYILVDMASSQREFRFFRVGSDLALLAFLGLGLAGVYTHLAPIDYARALGELRWVFLIYLFAYSLELFPGLHRLFYTMTIAGLLCAVYGIVQHFTGLDFIRGSEGVLAFAPIKENALYMATGFFRSPEIFGTMLSMLLPFPAAAFLLADRRDVIPLRIALLVLTLVFSVAIWWTYRPGLWLAAIVGLVVLFLVVPGRKFLLALTVAGSLGALMPVLYSSPAGFLEQIQHVEQARAAEQRAAINEHVQLFMHDTWLGGGLASERARQFDTTTGNIYFQLLSQTGALGLSFYLVFILGFLLMTYRLWQEIPSSHYWHRVFVSASLGSQIAFHASGLYWSTLQEAHTLILFAFLMATVGYVSEHYSRGIVSDDQSL